MGEAADRSDPQDVRVWGYLTAGITGLLALVGGLVLAPTLGDLLLPSSSFEFFPSISGPSNQPEPTEFMRYAFAAVAPVVAASGIVLAGQGRRRLSEWVRRAGAALAIALPVVVVVALILVWLDRALVVPYSEVGFAYFSDLQAVFALILAVAIALAAAHPATRRLASRADGNHTLIRLAPVGAFLVVILFLLPVVQTEASFGGVSGFVLAHMESTAADFEAFVNGATPGVDVAAQYSNLLPYVLGPLSEAAGFEPGAMTVLLTLLSALVLIALYRVLVGVTGSALAGLVLFVPVVALSLAPSGGEGALVTNNANLFQVMPIRYLGPALVAWLLVRHLLGRRRDVGQVGIFLTAGLAALSTPDFGVAAVLAAAVTLLLLAATGPDLGARTLRLVRDALAGLLGALALFALITLVRSGSLPDPSVLTYYPDLYGAKGFGLLPMEAIGFHWFLYVTFAGALIFAAVRAARSEPNRALTGMLAFFSVLGLAAAVYYVGRTNQFGLVALFPIWGMVLALLSWVVLWSLGQRPAGWGALRSIGILGWLVLLGLGLAITATSWMQGPWKEVDRLLTRVEGVTAFPYIAFQVDPYIDFVEPRIEAGEEVAVICRNGYLIADRARVTNVSPISDPQGLVGDEQVGEVVDALRASGGDKVFSCRSVSYFKLPPEIEAGLVARGLVRTDADKLLGITEWTLPPES